jgi:quinol monooxygenase YgiN
LIKQEYITIDGSQWRDKMIKVVAKGFAQEDKVNEVIEMCKELVELTRKEEGCISYELYQDINDSTILTFIEEWESQEALDKHNKSEHFTRIVPMKGKLMAKPTEVTIYNKVL